MIFKIFFECRGIFNAFGIHIPFAGTIHSNASVIKNSAKKALRYTYRIYAPKNALIFLFTQYTGFYNNFIVVKFNRITFSRQYSCNLNN